MSTYADYAEELIENGYSVTPVRDKAPFFRDWQTYLGESILDKKFNSHWASCNGLGLLTGRASSIVCLDIDILSNNERLIGLRDEIEAMLPPVFCGIDGNPNKIPARLYLYNGEQSEKFLSIDCEILADGNQKVLPPSTHPDFDKKYEWVNKSLHEIDLEDLPVLPDGIIDFLRAKNQEFKVSNKQDHTLTKASGRCCHGSHNVISALGVALLYKKYPFDMLVKRLLRKDRDINSVSDYFYFNCPTRKWKSEDKEENAKHFVDQIFINHGPDGEIKEEVREYETKDDGFYFKVEKKDGSTKEIPDYDGLADYLINEQHLKCDDSLVYVWSGKHYKSISFLHLKNIVNGLVKPSSNVTAINNFHGKALIKSFEDFSSFSEVTGYLNCNNGLLNVLTGELNDHTPDKFIKYVLDHNYSPEAKCPVFLNALNTVTDGDEDLQRLIQQVFGYCIIGGAPLAHKAFMFYGDGGNGKSTILTALSNLVGQSNASRVPLTLFDKPFSMISLDGKLVNLIDETPKFNINPEAFKNVVSGGYVRAAHKGKPEVDLKMNVRVVFACNHLPNFKDDSDGMLRRLVIIPFNHKINEKEIDYNIDEKISSEMSGVLNWSIEGLRDLINSNYRFSQGKATSKALDIYREETDSVYNFFKECTEFLDGPTGDEEFIAHKKLYKKYKEFCLDNGLWQVGERIFSRNATKHYEKKYNSSGIKFDDKCRQKYGKGKGIKRFRLLM